MPRADKRRTVSPGVYLDRYGYEVRWRDRGHGHQKRFPLDTPLEHVKEFRRAQVQRAKKRSAIDGAGSLVRDGVRFLRTRKGLASFGSDRSHLKPWLRRFRRLARWAITAEQIEGALQDWAREGYSAATLRHRLRVLTAFYQVLDRGVSDVPTLGVKMPKGLPPPPRQRRPQDDLITFVARNLRLQEMPGIGRLRDAKTRARFLTLSTVGMRPAQLKRALRVDILLDLRLWIVQPAKGDKGAVIYLNDEMLAATLLFIAADAFGWFDGRSFVKTLQRNGWPKGIRPYNVRHAVGQALKRGGVRIEDIRDHLGHRSSATTETFYLEPELAQLKATSEKLEGRIGTDAFQFPVPQPTTTRTRSEKAKGRENRPEFDRVVRTVGTAEHAALAKKTA